MQRSLCSSRHVTCNLLCRRFTPRIQHRYASNLTKATPSPSADRPVANFRKHSPLPWVVCSILGGAIGLYSVQIYLAAQRPCTSPDALNLSTQKDVSGRYEYTASSFDGEVGMSEMLMGINGIRKRLSSMAKGHVLEVSCGTGRNLGYYDIYRPATSWFTGAGASRELMVNSLTFVDLSPGMVEVCRKKWNALLGTTGQEKLRPGLVVRFLPASALEVMPPAPGVNEAGENGKYDTIIQTMGLCSTPHPVEIIVNMARHLDTANPESRILLLEHGRSYQQWLNNILDNAAEKHAEIHGCWFNRDIGELVEEAAEKSGLEVVQEKRWHFGTTWLFVLKPTTATVEAAVNKLTAETTAAASVKSATGRWFGWSSVR